MVGPSSEEVRGKLQPIVLIATTTRWFPTARLGMALANAGCIVEGVCLSHHPLEKVSAVRRTHHYNNLFPEKSLMRAILTANPELVIPGDDLAAQHLHSLHRREASQGRKELAICRVLERSLGSSESFPLVYDRASIIQLAQREGVRCPETSAIRDLDELRGWTAKTGFPVVLKADGTWGGQGVRVASNVEEAQHAFRKLYAPPLLARAVKRALLDGDRTLLAPSLRRRHAKVSAQSFISGCDATSTVACWEGKVLAALHFEVVNKKHAAGPATVMRLVESREMSSAVETMVRRLDLSGIHGFDFVLESHTGHAYLIEINPRTTQVGHLALGAGRDLPAALACALTKSSVRPTSKVTDNDTIALFPQEWMRDPSSPFLQSAYHDVPWEEPELVRACVQRARRQNRSVTQHDWDLAVAQFMRLAPKQNRSTATPPKLTGLP